MKYTVTRIKTEHLDTLRKMAEDEERKIATVLSRIIEKGLAAEAQPTVELPKSNPTLKKEKKAHPAFSRCKEIFFEKWQEKNRFDYTGWTGAQASALKSIIRKFENQGIEPGRIEEVFAVLIEKLPAFYVNKNLSAINSNLDGIISEIRNGQNTKVQSGGIYDFRS